MAHKLQHHNSLIFKEPLKGKGGRPVPETSVPDWLKKTDGVSYSDIYKWLASYFIPFDSEVIRDKKEYRQFAMDRKIILSEVYKKPLEEKFGLPKSDKEHGTCYTAVFRVTKFPTLVPTVQSKRIYEVERIHQHTYVNYLTLDKWKKYIEECKQKKDSKK